MYYVFTVCKRNGSGLSSLVCTQQVSCCQTTVYDYNVVYGIVYGLPTLLRQTTVRWLNHYSTRQGSTLQQQHTTVRYIIHWIASSFLCLLTHASLHAIDSQTPATPPTLTKSDVGAHATSLTISFPPWACIFCCATSGQQATMTRQPQEPTTHCLAQEAPHNPSWT